MSRRIKRMSPAAPVAKRARKRNFHAISVSGRAIRAVHEHAAKTKRSIVSIVEEIITSKLADAERRGAGQAGAAHGGVVLFFALGGLSLVAVGVLIGGLFLLGYALEPSAKREWARKRAELRDSLENRRVK